MAWDAQVAAVVTFGGGDGYSPYAPVPGVTCTYAGDGHWIRDATDVAPETRMGTAMAYDSVRDDVVLFGGITHYNQLGAPGARLHGDTWTFAYLTWTLLNLTPSPSPRAGASMAFDPADSYILLFGGTGLSGAVSDTWAFNGTWTRLMPAASPAARSYAGMAYDPRSGQVVLFGGLDNASQPLGDTWTFHGGEWTPMPAGGGPRPRYSPGMAYDAEDRLLVLFGGGNATSEYGDTWAYAARTWTQQAPSRAPPPSPFVVMTYDVNHGYVVTFAGSVSTGDWWYYGIPFVVTIGSASRVTVGSAVEFSASVSGGTPPFDYTWGFADGSFGFGPNATHTFATPGAYPVGVIVHDSLGAVANATVTITVQDVFFGLGWWAAAGFAVGVGAFLIAGIMTLRRHRRAPPEQPPPSGPPPEAGPP